MSETASATRPARERSTSEVRIALRVERDHLAVEHESGR
jgi:hypothetical protein